MPQLAELYLSKEKLTALTAADAALLAAAAKEKVWRPKRLEKARTCVATMADCNEIGNMVSAEAYRRSFQAAALPGDGSARIWNLHAKWFRDLTPMVDFVHALTYLYVTATVLASSVS